MLESEHRNPKEGKIMNFMTQLGLLAIILIILVILIKSNQTLEQIYMEGEIQKEIIEIPPFQMPEIRFLKEKKKAGKKRMDADLGEKETKKSSNPMVDRAPDTLPVEITSGWYLEMVDTAGRSFGRTCIGNFPFYIGRAKDNDYVIDDLSVSGHHASIEKENGNLTLIDQGSLNKILLGGRPVERIHLTEHMEVFFGNTKVRFFKEEKKALSTIAYQKNSFMEEWY